MGAGATTPISDRFRDDVRMDNRLKPLNSFLGMAIEAANGSMSGITSREELLSFYSTRPKRPPVDVDSLEIVPADGLTISRLSIPTSENGQMINICVMRPDMDDLPPCVYYIHGGGMMTSSCFDPMYQCWGRTMARQGICVVMPDFRNSISPSSVEEVLPFPAGHNDCVDGLKWVHANADTLRIDNSRILLSGESVGGNLALTTGIRLKREGKLDLIKGIYVMGPVCSGTPEGFPSRIENQDITIHFDEKPLLAYGIEEVKNPLAWPINATVEDFAGFPATTIVVNECDPLRDEGIAVYRTLLKAGVAARCEQIMGTSHVSQCFTKFLPEIAYDTARTIAAFASTTDGGRTIAPPKRKM